MDWVLSSGTSGRRIDRADQQQRPVAGRLRFVPTRLLAGRRDRGEFRKDRTAVRRRAAYRLRSARIHGMGMMLRGNGTALHLNGGRRRGHAERRCHQQGDDDHLRVVEYAPKSHPVGFPFRRRTVRRQKCSRSTMMCGALRFGNRPPTLSRLGFNQSTAMKERRKNSPMITSIRPEGDRACTRPRRTSRTPSVPVLHGPPSPFSIPEELLTPQSSHRGDRVTNPRFQRIRSVSKPFGLTDI